MVVLSKGKLNRLHDVDNTCNVHIYIFHYIIHAITTKQFDLDWSFLPGIMHTMSL